MWGQFGPLNNQKVSLTWSIVVLILSVLIVAILIIVVVFIVVFLLSSSTTKTTKKADEEVERWHEGRWRGYRCWKRCGSWCWCWKRSSLAKRQLAGEEQGGEHQQHLQGGQVNNLKGFLQQCATWTAYARTSIQLSPWFAYCCTILMLVYKLKWTLSMGQCHVNAGTIGTSK